MEQTGVTAVETLNRYVDWAFALGPLLDDAPTPSADIGQLARQGRADIAELEAERGVLTFVEYTERLECAMKRLVNELSRADGFTSERPPGDAMLAQALGDAKS